MTLHKAIFFIVIVFLQGCNPCPVSECGFPEVAFEELDNFGGTLTTRNEQVENIYFVAVPNDGQFVTTRLSFLFLPEEGKEYLPAADEGDFFFEVSNEYEVRYSQLISGEFYPIAPTFTEWDPQDQAINGYSSAVRFENSERDMLISSNHLLHINLGVRFVAPVNASHIELWRVTPENENILVRRIELARLAYWQDYIMPLLDR